MQAVFEYNGAKFFKRNSIVENINVKFIIEKSKFSHIINQLWLIKMFNGFSVILTPHFHRVKKA